jgi:hypothetical protein
LAELPVSLSQLSKKDTPMSEMQNNLGFVISQTAHVETEVFQVKYPDIQYPDLIDVDTSAHPWAKTVTYYSMDGTGQARFINGKANDIPLVTAKMGESETKVELAGIGYDYSLEEVNQAIMLGLSLDSMKALVARRSYEELVDSAALNGETSKGMQGLFAYASVPAVAAPNGVSGTATWATKTPTEIIKDINDALTGVFTATKTTGLADTVLLPWERLSPLTTITLPNTSMTILQFIRENNLYTLQTGQPLKIRGVRGLVNKGSGGTARMVAYRKSPEVMKLHLPMPLMFLDPQVVGLSYVIPGVFRFGGLDIRLPSEVRYVDGI